MTLPVSGAISFNAINVELGVAGTTQASLGQTSYRTLAGVASGAISMSNFYGKSNRVTASATISANTSNYTLNTAKATGYVAGMTDMTLTISSGVYVSSASTGSYALTVDTSWNAADTVTIVNNGTIIGRGGNGGAGYTGSGPAAGSAAGPALLVQRATSINNANRISGGGGGGGGGAWGASGLGTKSSYQAYGGGGGGGIGVSTGGTAIGGTGSTAGAAGTLTGAGSGGSGGSDSGQAFAGAGGSGGSYGAAGATGGAGNPPWPGGAGTPGAGGAAGACLVGNSYITWIAVGTRNGSIS